MTYYISIYTQICGWARWLEARASN